MLEAGEKTSLIKRCGLRDASEFEASSGVGCWGDRVYEPLYCAQLGVSGSGSAGFVVLASLLSES